VLGLGRDARPLPADASTELTLAIGVLIASLVFGLVGGAYVLNHIHKPKSVAENPWVMACAAAQMTAMTVGAIGFMVALVLL
jgi:uncharacterized protein YneF (UPF0154 family)